jgi:hypothetical protein
MSNYICLMIALALLAPLLIAGEDDPAKKISKASAEELLDLFEVGPGRQRTEIRQSQSVSSEEAAMLAELVRKRLDDPAQSVRIAALRVIEGLDNKMAVEWAFKQAHNATGPELIECVNVMVWRTGGVVSFVSSRPTGSSSDPSPVITKKILTLIQKEEFSLRDLRTYSLQLLLKENLSDDLRERVRQAVRQRAVSVKQKGREGDEEREMAFNILNPRLVDDRKILEAATRPENRISVRCRALYLLRQTLLDDSELSHLAMKYMDDSEDRVRSEAFGAMGFKDQFEWYSAYLKEKKRAGAEIVVGHLGRNGVIDMVLNNPSKYPFVTQFTKEQIGWLREAGLSKDKSEKWLEVLPK